MREFSPPPATMGWQLSDNLGDNRSLKERSAGKPPQIVAMFSFYVQPHDGEKNFYQNVQYPGSVVYTRDQIESGLPSLQNIPLSLQKKALAMFEAAANPQNNNVVELSAHRVLQPAHIPEEHPVRAQMFAQTFEP